MTGAAIGQIHRRIPLVLRGLPLLAAVPFAAEMLQDWVEIELGLYDAGTLDPAARRVRLAFGIVKLLGIVILLVAALRWWRFDGDARRALRPSRRMAAGLLAFVVLEIVDSAIEAAIGGLVARAVDLAAAPLAGRYAIHFAPTVAWTLLSGLWLPWNVGLLVDDPAMTLRRSVAAAWGRLWWFLGLVSAGVLPLMVLHYALGSAAIGQPPPLLWTLTVIDAGVVVVLTVAIGSSFYAVYDAARMSRSSVLASPGAGKA